MIEMYSRKVTKFTLASYKQLNVEKLFYEEGGSPLESASIEKRNFGTHPHLFVRWNETVIKSVRRYIKEEWRIKDKHRQSAVNIPFLNFLSGFLCRKLSDDFRLKLFAEASIAKKIFVFENPSMMRLLSAEKLKCCEDGKEVFNALKDSVRCVIAIMLIGFKFFKIHSFKKNKIKVKYFVVPSYQSVNSNAEFFSFYNAINDSAVLVDSGTELCMYLERQGSNIIMRNDLYINPAQILVLTKELLILLLHVTFKHRSWLLVNSVFRYIKEKAIILSYFNAVIPKYICIVRGDVYAAASLLRDIANKQSVKTVSFSHSSYYYPEYYLSDVDFDYFGASGQRELDVYSPYWNQKSNYIITGQMTSDYKSKISELPLKNNKRPELSVGVFPSSINDVVIPNSEVSFDDFVQAVVLAVSGVNDMVLYYKSKTKLKALRGDSTNYTISNDDRALRVFEKSLAERYVDLDEDYTVYDMYSLIDIGFVYSMSTCAFELMQKKCKVVVYVPFEKELHPFYKFTPLLVSSSIEEFIDKSKKIMTMSDENYSLYIKDTLNYCLIDSVTNDLGCEFVSAIEAVS